MAKSKTESVMAALKGRSGFATKKGVSLVGIVKKLSDKRKAMSKDPEEKGEKEDKKETKAQEETEKDE